MTTSVKHLYLLICWILAGGGAPLTAQSLPLGVPEIINFYKSDYRAGTQNWCLLQDQRDLLLAGNNKGILVFDGSRWELIALPNRTIVRSLARGEDGRIYVGAQDEFGFLAKGADGQWAYRSLLDRMPEADRSFEDVWKIFIRPDGIYFGTQKALFIYRDDKLSSVAPRDRFENFFLVGDDLYARDTGSGLVHWKDGRFLPTAAGERFRDLRIAAILPLHERPLIITESAGLFFLGDDGLTAWETPASTFLREHLAYCALPLEDGQVAIGTVRNGLVIMDSLGQLQLHLNKRSGLQNNTVLALYHDHQGNFWLGLDNGIDFVKTGAPFSQIRASSGIDGTGYTALHYGNLLYLGTNQGLYVCAWPTTERPFSEQIFRPVPALRGQMWHLQDLDGHLIVNTHEGAFYREGEAFRPLSSVLGSWKFLQLEGRPDYAVQGTYTGLYVYRRHSGSGGPPWRLSHKLADFEESARVIEEDANGNIWVSHAYKGLYKIVLTDDLHTRTVRFYSSDDGLPSDISINVAKIGGEVVFTAPDGVYYYDPATDRFAPQTAINDVLSESGHINRLLEDQSGRIWFSTTETFGFLDVETQGILGELSIEQSYFNNLQEDLVDGFESIYALDDRHVLIATERGFTNYDPHRGDHRDSLPFNVLIRRVVTLSPRDSLLFSDGLGPGAPDAAPIMLRHNFNSLRFTYVAPFFEHLGQIQYRYRLEGYEDKW
ncbi:MAG: hypothetical protein KDC54_20430, partial [Lewinella sp.]|nr:hypothetical protein [Lewinella sp.]